MRLFLDLAPGEGWKRRTVESHTDALRHARRYFRNKVVGQIRTSDCRAYRSWLSSPACPTIRTPRSVNWAYQAFRAVLSLAVEDRALPANPPVLRRSRAAGKTHEKFQGHFLSPAEVERVAAELYSPYDTMTRFMAYSGIRAGELSGLNVGDLRLTRAPDGGWGGVVTIVRTRHLVKGTWIEDTPKSAKSRRKVWLLGWLAEELSEYLTDVHPHANDPSSPLFPHRQNGGLTPGALDWSQPVEPASFRRNLFAPAVERAGLENVRLHDLRHTCASIMLTGENGRGMTPYELSEMLGHSSYRLTLDTYARWIPTEDSGHPLEGVVGRPVARSNVVGIR